MSSAFPSPGFSPYRVEMAVLTPAQTGAQAPQQHPQAAWEALAKEPSLGWSQVSKVRSVSVAAPGERGGNSVPTGPQGVRLW